MSNEIVNRVETSKLVVFDLEDYYPSQKIIAIDVAQWLEEGFILREKDFREHIKNHPWENYKDTLCYLYCSTDAIVPAWAYMLLTSYLEPITAFLIQGDEKQLVIQYYQNKLSTIDYSFYQDKPIIIKGCSNKPVPAELYVWILQKLQPYAQSIMYGEACSAVPLFKRKK